MLISLHPFVGGLPAQSAATATINADAILGFIADKGYAVDAQRAEAPFIDSLSARHESLYW